MDEKELEVIEILKKEGVILPIRILKNDTFKQLDRAISSGKPIIMKYFYDEVLRNFSQYIDLKFLKIFQEHYKNIKDESSKYQVSDDDEKIIEKLVNLNVFNLGEFGNVGNLLFVVEIVEELEKCEVPKKLKIFVMLNLYVILYETILYTIDRKIYYYLIENKIDKNKTIQDFLKIKRMEYNDHATANEINEIFYILKFINNKQNKSIFGDEKTRIFRNKITHANFFYDEENEKIIIGKESYSIEEFLVCYYRLLNFLLKWISKVFGDLEKEDFIKNFESKLNDLLSKLSRVFLKIERSGELKRVYTNVIFKLKSGEK
jgi:hypothetical protein